MISEEPLITTEGERKVPELRSGRKVQSSGKGLDKRDWNYSGTIGLKGDLAEQEIDILEDQIQTLKDKLAEMEKKTSMQLMEERIKNQANLKELEIKHEVALQNAKRYKRERPVDEDFTKPDGYIVSEETRVLLLDVLGKAAAALLHEAQMVMMQVDKEKLEREAKKIQGLVDSLEPVKAEQEARDISDSYELLGDARSHVHHGRLQLKKLRMTLGRHEESSGTGMALLMSDYDLTKEGVTESIKIIGDLPKIYYGEGGVDPKIIQKLRSALRKVVELENRNETVKNHHKSELELMKLKTEHYLNEKIHAEKQLRELSEAYRLKEETQEELQEAMLNGKELEIMRLEMARSKDNLEMKDMREQCKELLEEKTKLELELTSFRAKAEYLVGRMGKFHDFAADLAAGGSLDMSKEELVDRANKFRRLAEKEKASADANKEVCVKLRTVNAGYKMRLQEVSANMEHLVKQLMSINVGLANVVKGWLSQLTKEVTKQVELVWFTGELPLDLFIEWARNSGVFISREHLTLVFDLVADPRTRRIFADRLKSTLSPELEINSALMMMLRNSGKAKVDKEVTSSKLGRRLTELLQSNQGVICMQLSLLLNQYKHHKRVQDLVARHMSEMSINALADHLNLEVNSLISVINGGQPYGTRVSLSGEQYLGDSELLHASLAQNI